MTFRIFNEDARKTIADHIYGAPPVVPNRSWANSGTDLISQGVDTEPQEYKPQPGGTYRPQGSYDPERGTGGQFYPPTHTPGHAVQINCKNGVPANQSGSCPGPVTRNGQQFNFVRHTDGNGLAYCCPQAAVPGADPPVQPPMTFGDISKKVCPGGNQRTIVVYGQAEANTAKASQPFAGKTPLQFETELKANCGKTGGTFNKIKFSGADGSVRVAVACCGELNLPTTPVVPPPLTPQTPGPTPTQDYDGDDKNSTPESPTFEQITFRARPIADIPAGGIGWCMIEHDLLLHNPGNDCSKLSGVTLTTAKSTSALSTDCKKSNLPMIFARNPGAAVIERGVPVVAVKDWTGPSGGIQRATIVVVPCAT